MPEKNMENRPRGRQKNISGNGKDIYKRGEGLGTGPVGDKNGYQGRGGSRSASGGSARASGGTRVSGGGLLTKIIIAAVALLGGGGIGLSGLLGGGGGGTDTGGLDIYNGNQQSSAYAENVQQDNYGGNTGGYISDTNTFDLSSLLGGFTSANTSTGWTLTANTGKLDKTVAYGAREKRTEILGNGKDTVTVMVYMCGTDLESKSGMGTADLKEMTAATLGSNVNVIVYTGGCKKWNNNIVSSSVNQIYKIEKGGMRCLVNDAGSAAMTKSATLTSFIQWCVKNYPANRNELIFWDHGGGSLSGYGYDEKNATSGSMTLRGINEALSAANTSFDFIGFDACLMATTENALMLSKYADYLIASEETEPGVGWYYTNWLTKLSENTSMSTLDIGKNIVDDFVDACNRSCSGQKTTLSLIDLAELESTVPEELKAFSASTSELLKEDKYKQVSDARSGAREFSPSSRIDQVDLVNLAENIGTAESKKLTEAILGAVKYNRTSSNMTDAYGLSIYFPYQKVSNVDNAVATYEAIGMDSEYMRCIQEFASMETGGQAISGGAASPLSSILSAYSGAGTVAGTGAGSTDMITDLLSGLLGGSFNGISGLGSGNSAFLGKSLDIDSAAAYLSENRFDSSALLWQVDGSGRTVLELPEEQWSMVQKLELNVFYDDGEGYIDLGLDNVFDFTENGALLGEFGGTWLAINGQPVPYYHIDTYDDGDNYCITGRVPVMLNGSRADLILVFDNEHPTGYIAGTRSDYKDRETETVAKSTEGLQEGNVIDFVCDYYSYDGTYLDSYLLGEQLTVSGELEISDVYINAENAQAMYRFTDIYNQQYWTPVLR